MRVRTGLFAFVGAVVAMVVLVAQVPQVAQMEGLAAEVLAPIERTLSGSLAGLGDVVATVGRAGELKAENDRLRAENEALRSASVRVQELEHQNDDLRAQMGYQLSHRDQKLLQANVIAREPDDLIHSLTIDRGTNHGLAEGMTVVTPAGLVGRLLAVGPYTAQVLLVTDSKSSVSGLVVSTRAQGMIYGHRDRLLTMRYVDQMEKIEVDQWVVTSSLGGGFPPGIPIGKIVQVRQRDVEPFQEATIQPGVDFARLETVMVITSFLPVRME